MISTKLNRQTNEPIVTETRQPKPFRSLPRPVSDRIASLDASKQFLVRYQDFVGQYVSAVRCWKCGTAVCTYQPALRKVEGSRQHDGELTKVMVNGEPMILGAMLPFNHYREGLFTYRTPHGVLARFSFLHCADCHIAEAHGEDLLACLLGQFDHRRDHMKPYMPVLSDDAWAQYLFRWSGIELVGLDGPSLSPADLMQRKN